MSKLKNSLEFLNKEFNIKSHQVFSYSYSNSSLDIPKLTVKILDKELKIKVGDEIEVLIPEKKKGKMIISTICFDSSEFIHGYHTVVLESPISKFLGNSCFRVFLKKKPSEIIQEIIKASGLTLELKSPTKDVIKEVTIQYYESNLNFINKCVFFMESYWFIEDGKFIIGSSAIMKKKELKKIKKCGVEIDSFEIMSSKKTEEKNGFRILAYNSENPNINIKSEKLQSVNYQEHFFTNLIDVPGAQSMMKYLEQSHSSFEMRVNTAEPINLFEKIKINGLEMIVISYDRTIGFRENRIEHCYSSILFSMAKIRSFIDIKPSIMKALVVVPEKGAIEKLLFKDDKNRIMISFFEDVKKQIVPAVLLNQAAHGGEGSCFVPKANTEVLVDFLRGNPDIPMVIGCLYNKNNENKFTPQEFGWNFKTVGMEDRQTEIKMNLEKEKEILTLNSPKDIKMASEDGNFSLELHSKKDKDTNMDFKIKKGNYTIILEHGNLLIQTKKGNMEIKIDEGNQTIKISGNQKIEAKNIEISCENFKLNAKSSIELNGQSIKLKAKSSMELDGQSIKLNAQSKCEISAMESSINGKTKLEMKSLAIAIQASAKMDLKSAMMGIQSPKLDIQAAAVLMTGVATINGMVTVSGTVTCPMFQGVLKGAWIPG